MRAVIEECRRLFGPAPRSFGFWNYLTYIKARRPPWMHARPGDFLNEPFFRRGMSLYNEQVPLVSSAEFHDKVKKDPNTEVIRKALVEANKNLKILSDAGITIAMGTDSGVANNPGRWQGYFEQVEMEMMNKAGMSPMQVIVASTGNAAKIMELKDVGTLEKGKWADLVVLRGNPLQNILNTRTIDTVWIGGAKLADLPPVTSTK